MLFNVEQLAAANKAPLDFALAYYGALLNGAERIVALNIEMTRSVLLDSMTGARAMLDAQDAGKAAQIQTTTTKALTRKTDTYFQSVLEITAHTQEDLTQAIADQAGGYQRLMAQLFEMATSAAPAGARTATAAIRAVSAAAAGNIRNTSNTGRRLAKAA